jgi:hypothetical protein
MQIQTCSLIAGAVLTATLALAAPSSQVGAPTDPDHLTLFKLYMAANADVLDKDDQAAWEYHLLFKIPPGSPAEVAGSRECMALHTQLRNELTAKRLLEAARTEFRNALATVTEWPKTARFRLITSGALGEYDASSGAFKVLHLGASATNPRALAFPVPRDVSQRALVPQFRGTVTGWCPAPAPGQTLPPHLVLEVSGVEALGSVPMAAGAAEAFLNAYPGRGVQVELIVEAGPALIRPDRSPRQLPVETRVLQARVMDASGKEIHKYALGAASTTTAA